MEVNKMDFKNMKENELLRLLEGEGRLKAADELLNRDIDNDILLYIMKEFKDNPRILFRASVKYLNKDKISNTELRSFIRKTPYENLRKRAIVRLCGRKCAEKDLKVIMRFSRNDLEEAYERMMDLVKKKINTIRVEHYKEISQPLV